MRRIVHSNVRNTKSKSDARRFRTWYSARCCERFSAFLACCSTQHSSFPIRLLALDNSQKGLAFFWSMARWHCPVQGIGRCGLAETTQAESRSAQAAFTEKGQADHPITH